MVFSSRPPSPYWCIVCIDINYDRLPFLLSSSFLLLCICIYILFSSVTQTTMSGFFYFIFRKIKTLNLLHLSIHKCCLFLSSPSPSLLSPFTFWKKDAFWYKNYWSWVYSALSGAITVIQYAWFGFLCYFYCCCDFIFIGCCCFLSLLFC